MTPDARYRIAVIDADGDVLEYWAVSVEVDERAWSDDGYTVSRTRSGGPVTLEEVTAWHHKRISAGCVPAGPTTILVQDTEDDTTLASWTYPDAPAHLDDLTDPIDAAAEGVPLTRIVGDMEV